MNILAPSARQLVNLSGVYDGLVICEYLVQICCMAVKQGAKLLYASSEHDSDMRYFAGVVVPDAFIAFELGGRKLGVLSRLEYARVQAESAFDEVLALEALHEEARERYELKKRAGPGDVIRLLAERYAVTGFDVPHNFPVGLAFELQAFGLELRASKDKLFFAERLHKRAAEAEYIRAGNAVSTAGILAAESILREAEISENGELWFEGEVLTSERLRGEVDIACLRAGGLGVNTICAGGVQATDPHNIGTGVLRANELIIVDVFPRVTASGYYGDMTRTFLKGMASEEQRRLVKTVREAQLLALEHIRAGVSGSVPHLQVEAYFEKCGYKTEQRDGVWGGFFHTLGHGLGLDVHEPPRMCREDYPLTAGLVMSVEPGLYYREIGGCRIEDCVWVRDDGYELLSDCHYEWEIE